VTGSYAYTAYDANAQILVSLFICTCQVAFDTR